MKGSNMMINSLKMKKKMKRRRRKKKTNQNWVMTLMLFIVYTQAKEAQVKNRKWETNIFQEMIVKHHVPPQITATLTQKYLVIMKL